MTGGIGKPEIIEVPLSCRFFRSKVEAFLASQGLRTEEVDYYCAAQDDDGRILAGGGLRGGVIKCVAVCPDARGQGLTLPLVSHLVSVAAQRGYADLKVFTKPSNREVFESLGFHLIAEAPEAILLENGHGLESYLRGQRLSAVGACRSSGVVIMNANPFTLGHRFLIQKASRSVDNLFVIPVMDGDSLFPYEERLAMIKAGAGPLATVLDGSPYQISAATFPTYFLKDLNAASQTQMRLDLDLFVRHIVPALGVGVRFVGSEPVDPLTARYNSLMKEILPAHGVQVREIPRLAAPGSPIPVSASLVRKALSEGSFQKAAAMTPPSTWPYLVAELLARALRRELDTHLKPGLVGPDGPGAHSDMSYDLMRGSIDVIRRSFVRHLSETPVQAFGRAIEADVLAFTGGVNTHRGAIFSLGLIALAFLKELSTSSEHASLGELSNGVAALAFKVQPSEDSNGSRAVKEYGVKGALQMAREGYKPLFEEWLPYYRSLKSSSRTSGGDDMSEQMTLLKIMSTLDDTCVIHRAGYGRAQEVKREAGRILGEKGLESLAEFKKALDAEGVSPGGAADMLSATIFVDSLIN